MTFTHSTYADAMKQLRQYQRTNAANLVVTWDAGDGFTGRGYYCDWRKRIITETITPAGHSII